MKREKKKKFVDAPWPLGELTPRRQIPQLNFFFLFLSKKKKPAGVVNETIRNVVIKLTSIRTSDDGTHGNTTEREKKTIWTDPESV